MEVIREDILDIELTSGNVCRNFMNHAIGEGDREGQRFGIRVVKNGEPVELTDAACIGYFIRNDDITLVINGSTSGSVAYIDLPEAAYAVEGNFTLAIKLAGADFAETMRIIDGTVVNTTTGQIYDPSGVVPSLSDLLAVIERAEDAADIINGISVSATQITGTRYKISVTKE